MVHYTVNNNDLRNTYLAVGVLTAVLFTTLYIAGQSDRVGPWELAILIVPWTLSFGYLVYSSIDLYLWRLLTRFGLFATPSLKGMYAGKYWGSDSDYARPLAVNVDVNQTLSDIDIRMISEKPSDKPERHEGVSASIITQPYLEYLYYPFSSESDTSSDGIRSLHHGFCALEFDNDHHHVKGRYFTDGGGDITDGVMSLDKVSKADLDNGLELIESRPYRVPRPETIAETTANMIDMVSSRSKKKTRSSTSYSEKELLMDKNEATLEMYAELRYRILDIDDEIEVVPSKHHISFRANTPFVDIQVQKTQIKLWLNLSIGELDDPREIARDVSDVKHWGSGEYEMVVKPGEDIDYLMMLIKQSYRRNNL